MIAESELQKMLWKIQFGELKFVKKHKSCEVNLITCAMRESVKRTLKI